MARKPIGARTAIAVWERDVGRCVYCGRILNPGDVIFDHFVPVSRGGDTTYENLVLSCDPCNQGKGVGDGAEWANRGGCGL